MTAAKWLVVQPQWLLIAKLVPTNEVKEEWILAKLDDPFAATSGGDYLPHVVVYHHAWYIDDGHCRIAAAQRRGHDHIYARVLYTHERDSLQIPVIAKNGDSPAVQ